MEEAYSTFKIAEICRVTPRTVANWIDDNLIKSFKTPGNYRKVLRSDLEEFLRKNNMPMDGIREFSTKKVLIIEDDNELLKQYKRVLKNKYTNLEIETSKDGQDGLVKIAVFTPDIVLLDLHMPKIDGMELFRTVKNSKTDKKMEIIFISGHITEKVKAEFKKYKVKKYLEKPVSPDDLCAIVKDFV